MIYLKEILPNPVGEDTDGEWIKLINSGDGSVDTASWGIKDASGKTFYFNSLPHEAREIQGGKELILERSLTGITLNNDGDTVTLINDIGEVVDELTYTGRVSDDEIIIAERFMESIREDNTTPRSLEDLAFAGGGEIGSGTGWAVLFVAIAIAIASSFLVGVFSKHAGDK